MPKVYSTYETFEKYINELLDLGYLSKTIDDRVDTNGRRCKNRAFSLIPYYLNMVVKCHAIDTFQPYSYNQRDKATWHDYSNSFLYLTRDGKDWFFNFLESKSYDFLHHTFSTFFRHKEKPSDRPEHYRDWVAFGNIRGEQSTRDDTAYNRDVRVTRRWKDKRGNEYKEDKFFISLPAGREYILMMSRTFPVDEFSIYYRQNCGYYRKTTPIVNVYRGAGSHPNNPFVRKKAERVNKESD